MGHKPGCGEKYFRKRTEPLGVYVEIPCTCGLAALLEKYTPEGEMKRKKYPKCSHYRNGRHRFGMANLSFEDVCHYRCHHPGKNIDNICKCGFERAKRDSGHTAKEGE